MKLRLNIPETLEDIKLMWYQRYLSNEEKYETSIFKRRSFIEQCCGFDSLGLVELSPKDSYYLFKEIERAFNGRYELPIIKKIIVSKNEFKLIDLNKITMSEYKVLEDSLLDLNKIHMALSVLYRDSSGKYNKDYDEFMKHMPLNVVYGVLNHFTKLFNDIMKEITGNDLPITTEHILLSGKDNKDFVRIVLKNNNR